MHDVLVLGSGIAGLTTALHAAARGMSVVVLTKGELSHSATRYAQGGVAAALEDPDSPDLHLADTLLAGAGLCDVDAVRALVTEGPARVRELAELGARFDTEIEGDGARLLLAREGGHSLARVVHAGGDATGAEIERALVAAVDPAPIEVRERWFALELIVEAGTCRGARALGPDGAVEEFRANDTVLATGGVGQCFAVTTNPTLSTGDGIALALRAGVACADLEFVQFHPTALHHPSMPRPLLSEALRGEGAVLRDVDGVAFMSGVHPLADLAPRDVVSRAIHGRMRETGTDHVYLDASMIPDFAARFPTIWRACQSAGLDPTRDLLPVAPAAHYLSGGVVTDLDGASTLPRLWSCGEAACSGVHGANRLASNSLLDGLVFGRRVVAAIATGRTAARPTGAMDGVLQIAAAPPGTAPDTAHRVDAATDLEKLRNAIQRTMSAECGVVRDAGGLRTAAGTLSELSALAGGPSTGTVAACEVLNLLCVSDAIVTAATIREESRGAHTRADFPDLADAFRGRIVLRGGPPPVFVELPAWGTGGVVSTFDPPDAAVRAVVTNALAEDAGLLGDITSIACIDAHETGRASFVAREAGVLAGTAAAAEVYRQVDRNVMLEWERYDGDAIDGRTVLGRMHGPLRSILLGERVALNLLSHCSGVASLTRRCVNAVGEGGPRIRDTRKTIPGLRALQRGAVRAGGGYNHRDSLSDAVLVKDNHLAGRGLTETVRRARALWPGRVVEVECDSIGQVKEARDAGADIVMLDNMNPAQVLEAVDVLDGACRVEISGGVTLDALPAYARSGADFISIGALTHSARALDIGLDLE